MALGPPKRYELRPVPVVIFGCVAASYLGVELAGAAFDLLPNLFAGKPLVDPREYPHGLLTWLYSTALAALWVVQAPLIGFVVVVWPALAIGQRWKPDCLGPKLIYTLGFTACIVGGIAYGWWSIAEFLLPGAFAEALTALRDTVAFGAEVGLPAAVIFRVIALRSVRPQVSSGNQRQA